MARTPRQWANAPKDNTARLFTHGWQDSSNNPLLAYAATIALTFLKVNFQRIFFDALTGDLTVNATLTNCEDLDEYMFYFSASGAQRIVTFGTNFLSSGTITIPSGKTATARGYYNASTGKIHITGREITA